MNSFNYELVQEKKPARQATARMAENVERQEDARGGEGGANRRRRQSRGDHTGYVDAPGGPVVRRFVAGAAFGS